MKKRYIYALGCFDGVHLGHRALLSACCRLAEETGCRSGAVTFRNHPQQLLSTEPIRLINTNPDREEMLLGQVSSILELAFTQELRTMPWQDFLAMLVTKYHAAGFVCGTDFRFGSKGQGTAALLQQYCREKGLQCALVEQQYLDGVRISSTHIRSLLEQGEVREANRFLGHPHCLSGTVEKGQQLGRTIGIPTANLAYPGQLLKMPRGVYATRVEFEGQKHWAITNIGTRPTVNGSTVTVESYLPEFSGDLYGKTLTVYFYDFIRPEQKFADMEQLRSQIEKDISAAKAFFEKQ